VLLRLEKKVGNCSANTQLKVETYNLLRLGCMGRVCGQQKPSSTMSSSFDGECYWSRDRLDYADCNESVDHSWPCQDPATMCCYSNSVRNQIPLPMEPGQKEDTWHKIITPCLSTDFSLSLGILGLPKIWPF